MSDDDADGHAARDETRVLAEYLRRSVDESVTTVELLENGMNRTFTAATDDDSRAYAVRVPGELRDRFYVADAEREYAVLQRLAETPIETPEPVAFCGDRSLIGDPFFVTTYLDGAVVPLGDELPDRFQRPSARRAFADRLIDTLASIHDTPIDAFTDCCERRTPRDGLDHHLTDLADATVVPSGVREQAITVAERLRATAPDDPPIRLCHGDFRPGNVLFAPSAEPTVAGVIDWETAWLGDPSVELGYLLLRWHDDGDPTPSLDSFETLVATETLDAETQAEIRADLRERNEQGLAPFTNAPGSPTRAEIVARYTEITGHDYRDDGFYLSLAAFQLAAVWLDFYRLNPAENAQQLPYVEHMLRTAELLAPW